MRKTLALILALVLALSCMGFAVAEPVAEQVEEAVAEIEEVAIGAAAEDAVVEEAESEQLANVAALAYTKVDDSALDNPSEDGSAKGHEYYEEFTTTVTPTCTTKGGTYYICQIPGCGHTALKKDTGSFLGGDENKNGLHVAAPGATTVHYYATCMNPEYDLISKCKFCNQTNVQNYKDDKGKPYEAQKIHFDPAATVLVEIIKEPTCTEEGLGKYLCQNCPHDADASRKYKEMAIPKAEHQWEVWGKEDGTTEQPVEELPSDKFVRTCVEGGWSIIEGKSVRYCKVCFTVHPDDKPNVIATAPANHAVYMDDYFDYLEKGEEDKIIDKKLVNDYTESDAGKWVYDSTTDKLTLDEAEVYYYFNGNIFVENADIAKIEAVPGVAKEIKGGKTIYHLPTDTSRPSTHLGPVDIEIVAPTCETAGSVTMTCTLCKATVSGIIPALGHKWMNEMANSTVEALDPKGEYNCMEMGIQTHLKCAECSKEVNSGYFENHWYDRVVYMQQQEGDTRLMPYAEADLKPCLDYEIWTYCANQVGVDSHGNPVYCTCHKTQKVAHTKEHSYLDSQNLVPTATCTEDGEEYFYCQYCYKMIAKPVKALGHVAKRHDDKGNSLAHIITAATCTEDGLRGYPCQRCGLADAVKEKIPALGHRYEEVYDPAVTVRFEVKDDNGHIVKDELGNIVYTYYDCEKKGVIAYKCSRCGGTTKEEVGPQHQWYTYAELVAADYDVDAAQKAAIERIKANAIANKDNTYKEPTCTTDGWITAQCHKCGNMVNAFKLPKLGHDRTRPGYDHDAECKAGNASMNDILFKGVYYTGYVPATCVAPAYYWYSCKCTDPMCPAKSGEVIVYNNSGMHWAKADGTLSDTKVEVEHLVKVNDGAKDPSAHISVFSQDVVTDLQYTKYHELTDTGFVITKMPTCEETGTALYICELCKAQTSMTLPKLPHNNVLTWNATTRKYEKACKKLPVAQLNDYINNKLANFYTNKLVLEELADRLTKLSQGKTYVPGIGGHTEAYEVEKLTYNVKISDDAKTVNIAKKSDTNDAYFPVLYVSWQYTLPDGSNFSYVKTFDTIKFDWGFDGPVGSWSGTKGIDVRIGNPQPSADWKLDTIVAIACDDLDLETKSQNEANHLDLGHDVKQF